MILNKYSELIHVLILYLKDKIQEIEDIISKTVEDVQRILRD